MKVALLNTVGFPLNDGTTSKLNLLHYSSSPCLQILLTKGIKIQTTNHSIMKLIHSAIVPCSDGNFYWILGFNKAKFLPNSYANCATIRQKLGTSSLCDWFLLSCETYFRCFFKKSKCNKFIDIDTAIAKKSVINQDNWITIIFVHLLAKYVGSFRSTAELRKFSLCFATSLVPLTECCSWGQPGVYGVWSGTSVWSVRAGAHARGVCRIICRTFLEFSSKVGHVSILPQSGASANSVHH